LQEELTLAGTGLVRMYEPALTLDLLSCTSFVVSREPSTDRDEFWSLVDRVRAMYPNAHVVDCMTLNQRTGRDIAVVAVWDGAAGKIARQQLKPKRETHGRRKRSRIRSWLKQVFAKRTRPQGGHEAAGVEPSRDAGPPTVPAQQLSLEEAIAAGLQPDVQSMERRLKKRLSLLESECAHLPGLQTMKPRWEKLLVPDVLAFSVSAIGSELQKSMEDGTHHYRGRRFEGVSVCVSTIPTMDPVRARALFQDGYRGFLTVIMNELGFAEGETDLAHWIYMAEGSNWNIDITFMPSRNMVRTQGRESITVVARDLLTDAERRML